MIRFKSENSASAQRGQAAIALRANMAGVDYSPDNEREIAGAIADIAPFADMLQLDFFSILIDAVRRWEMSR